MLFIPEAHAAAALAFFAATFLYGLLRGPRNER